jgi:hypothetical protein
MTYAGGGEKHSRILFRNLDLFLAQKIKVGVTSGACSSGKFVVSRDCGSVGCTRQQAKAEIPDYD